MSWFAPQKRTVSRANGRRAAQPAPNGGTPRTRLWCEIIALACELLAGMQMSLTGPARRSKPKPLRPRLFAVAGRLVRRGPPPAAPTRRDLPGHGRPPPRSPACRPSRPADQPKPSQQPGEETNRGTGGTPPARRDSRATRLTGNQKTAAIRSSRPPSQDHERFRLTASLGNTSRKGEKYPGDIDYLWAVAYSLNDRPHTMLGFRD